MRTQDLRDVLHVHADRAAAEDRVQDRVAAVHQRVGAARRRRRAGAVTAAVAAVAAAALSVVPVLDGSRAPQPAHDPRPAGVSNGVVTFRQTVARDRLLDAVIGEPGERTVSFDVRVPTLRLRLSTTCYGAPRNLYAQAALDGHELGGESCGGAAQSDPGPSGMLFTGTDTTLSSWGVEPGDTVHVTVSLRHPGPGGGPATDPDVVLGVGLYRLGPSAGTVAGWDVPRFSEYGAARRLWEYRRSVVSEPGARELVLHLPAADAPRMVSMVMSRVRGGTVVMSVDGEPGSRFGSGTGSGGAARLAPGRPHTVRLVHRGGSESPHGRLAVVVNRPAK